jgi:hypothetical protein
MIRLVLPPVLASLATVAAAGPPCGPREAVVAHLAERYGESRRAIGLAANSMVMELFAAETSGSWTIAVTRPDGVMCLIASGQGFEAVDDPLPAAGDPA